MKPVYINYVACVMAFLALGLYDVKDNFKGLFSGMALMLLLLAAIVGSASRGRFFANWKLFFTGLFGFVLSTFVGSMFNPAVERAATAVVASIYDYKKQTGVYPDSLMQVAVADNIKDMSKNRIKYGSRVHYLRMDDGFYLGYDTYAFNGRAWDMEKKAFVEVID
ncbi:hypothetical protein F2P45_18955 [Massilia sp. CCM 8733]|uniref:Uncharacterized protein n=1 Tax=Massilia mucilaginosa TaxID=2609282 RepID=A0ABX0NWQ7_9BURK|nr:hypothetical protein [Massilia mucilaginosa]NHZ91080.1 hypothetical protein [Massilia mucilaginosa]